MPDELMAMSRDHDLLVRLDAKLDGLSGQFLELRLALATKADGSRVERLERQLEEMQANTITAKADVVQVNKIEALALAKADAVRVEKLEALVSSMNNKLYIATGALSAIQIGIHLFWR